MLRVLVIGTSNAIYKDGYVGGIRDHLSVSAVDRYAVGASPSVIIPFLGLDIDFSIYDLVVFDTAINDRNYYKYNSIRKGQIREFIEWGVDRCRKANVTAFLLLMPSKKAFNKETISGTIYHKIAKENNLPILDGFEYVREVCRETDIGINNVFIDNFHINKPIAFKLGQKIIDVFLEHDKTISRRASNIIPPKFYRLDARDFSTSTVRRSSSIAGAEFFRLEATEKLRLPVKPGDMPVGIAFNAPKSSGSLSISGVSPALVKSLTTTYSNSNKDFQLIIMPVVSITKAEGGFIELSTVNIDVRSTEASRFDDFSLKLGGQNASIEIASIMMKANSV